VATDPAEVAERLSGIAEELADLALEQLRQASEAVRSGEDPDPRLVAEEKRITRARRSVERAAAVLAAGPDGRMAGADEGP
jgi:hypothetical protein